MAIEQSLVTLPQCYNKQDYDWSEELDSVHILAQAVQEAPLFEWLFIYLSCFRTIDLISLLCCYVELRFNARFFRNTNCECQRRWDKIHISVGAMVQTEASWYPRLLSSCLTHNQILPQQWPRHWGAPRIGWDMLRPMRHYWPSWATSHPLIG